MRVPPALLCVCCWAGAALLVMADDSLADMVMPLAASAANMSEVSASFATLCAARGVPDPERLLNKTAAETMQCVQERVALDQLMLDMTTHIAGGTLDQLVAERCRKQLPEAVSTCSALALERLQPCWLSADAQNDTADQQQADVVSKKLRKVLMAGVEFFCYRDGERVAIFLHESGRECMRAESTREAGRHCLSWLGVQSDLWLEAVSVLTEWRDEVRRQQHCQRLQSIRRCMTSAFETCNSSTPANVVDSVLAVMLEPLECRDSETSPAGQLAATSTLTLAVLLVSLLKL